MANSIFYNSDYLVIEYMDMVKQPMLHLLNAIREIVANDPIDEKFKLAEILKIDLLRSFQDTTQMVEFYLQRKHQNIFYDILTEEALASELDVEDLLQDQISSSYRFFSDAAFLPASSVITYCKKKHLVNDVIVYYPYDAKYLEENINAVLGVSVKVMNDFSEIVKMAGSNSTYFLADYEKLRTLNELSKLRYSSVVLPVEYRYNDNKIDDILENEKNVFKISFMRACTYPREDQPSLEDDIKDVENKAKNKGEGQ